ncbi:acyltransferase family protein [Halotia branconii]|uniref:Acyltransferase n=1 Tax=Halotia branconii CENA392 TaxID=1539056 RepID=A0AAJ6NW23_9CYAN|nr:acyltransferase [Halotia branconii]WGV27805.1 acyltransferase [Halotia branconii CENA392]
MKQGSPLAPLTEKSSKVRFYFLDAFRGLAALWVVLYHAESGNHITQLSKFLPEWIVLVVFKWGHLGVSIFFVLSGFVIAHSLRAKKINLAYFSNFTLGRFIRLSIPYYASIVLVLCLMVISSKVKGEVLVLPSLESLLAHLLYLQEILGLKQINTVYWTLCLEMQFYVIFCLVLGLSQKLDDFKNVNSGRALIFVPVSVLAAVCSLQVFNNHLWSALFLPYWYSFLLGAFAYWSYTNVLKPVYFYFYCAVITFISISDHSLFMFTCVIVATLFLEVGRTNRLQIWLNWRWLQFISLISYSLYLVHNPITGATFLAGFKLLGHFVWTEVFLLIVTIMACTVCAWIMWKLVEQPSIELSRKVK